MATDITPQYPVLTFEEEVLLADGMGESFGDTLGGWVAGSGELSQGKLRLQSGNERILIGAATEPLTGTGIFIGNDGAVVSGYDFRAGNPSGNYIHWDESAGTLTIVGALTATSGTIGGFSIGTDYIRDAADTFGLASTVTGGDDVRFWAGAAFASRASAPFRVTEAGAVVATSLAHSGGSITGVPISSIPNDTNTDLSLLEYTHNLVFSVTDADTIAWGSGTITMHNGRTFSITGSNTGNMAARTYIYLDTGISSTALQTTTTVATAMGPNKILIAVAQNASGQAVFQVYGGIGGIKLTSSQVNISNNNWTYSGTWSVTDADTIAWASGTLKTSDGTSYSITGSNTGNMAAKTYIYFDLAVSSTAFQTTTTATTAIGDGKILIAIAQNGTNEANYIVVNDKQHNIDAANIVTGSITANELATGSVTATKISVTNLAAINADLGSITAGTVTGATIRTASSGTRFSMTSSTFQGINASGTVVFEVLLTGNVGDVIMGDDASGNYAIWDNSAGTFSVFADNVPTVSQGFFGGDGSDGALSISSGTTTLSAASAATLVKNYTSISVTSTGVLAFSNPHSGGTLITLKSQGNVTLTSTSPAIDTRGMGAAGGVSSLAGTEPNALLINTNTPAGGGDGGAPGTAGARYDTPNFYTTSESLLARRYIAAMCGAGGGCGGILEGSGSGGGRGGGGLIIECAGALNFTGTINASGSAGSNAATAAGGREGGGGGGGGSAGMVVVLYNTLTSSSGTITASGGAGGAGVLAAGSSGSAGRGGGGAGSVAAAGGAGGDQTLDGNAAAGLGAGGGGGGGDNFAVGDFGVGGAAGGSMGGLVAKNVYFA